MKSICIVYNPNKKGLIGKYFKVNENGVTPSSAFNLQLATAFNKTSNIVFNCLNLNEYHSLLNEYSKHYHFLKRNAKYDHEFWNNYKGFFDTIFKQFEEINKELWN